MSAICLHQLKSSRHLSSVATLITIRGAGRPINFLSIYSNLIMSMYLLDIDRIIAYYHAHG